MLFLSKLNQCRHAGGTERLSPYSVMKLRFDLCSQPLISFIIMQKKLFALMLVGLYLRGGVDMELDLLSKRVGDEKNQQKSGNIFKNFMEVGCLRLPSTVSLFLQIE